MVILRYMILTAAIPDSPEAEQERLLAEGERRADAFLARVEWERKERARAEQYRRTAERLLKAAR